jgi:hypothetical protein
VAAIESEALPLDFEPAIAALVIIDMQRDVVLPGGFSDVLDTDSSPPLTAGAPGQRVPGDGRMP